MNIRTKKRRCVRRYGLLRFFFVYKPFKAKNEDDFSSSFFVTLFCPVTQFFRGVTQFATQQEGDEALCNATTKAISGAGCYAIGG